MKSKAQQATDKIKGNGTDAERFVPVPIEASLLRGATLHFFSQLCLSKDAADALAELGFSRVHQRILTFSHLTPGITISELLSILRVNHHDVQRALRKLVQEEYIVTKISAPDRRQKMLYSTDKGAKLMRALSRNQLKRIQNAYELSGPEAVQGFFTVLNNMIEDSERAWVERVIEQSNGTRP